MIILKICFTPRILKYTDFNPLTYIKTSCKVNAIGQRWVNELASFSFSVHYKPGAQNHVVFPSTKMVALVNTVTCVMLRKLSQF